MSFSSVDDFLRQANQAKGHDRKIVEEGLAPLLEDSDTFVIPPAIAIAVDEASEEYGDELLKELAIVCLGKWLEKHQSELENQSVAGIVQLSMDMGRIIQAIESLANIGSFSGNDAYLDSMRQQINQAVLEQLEEDGRDPSSVFE
jgi:hypothetical protein